MPQVILVQLERKTYNNSDTIQEICCQRKRAVDRNISRFARMTANDAYGGKPTPTRITMRCGTERILLRINGNRQFFLSENMRDAYG